MVELNRNITINAEDVIAAFLEVISESQLGKSCCGSNDTEYPFTVQGDQTYIRDTFISEAKIPRIYLITSHGDVVDTMGFAPRGASGPFNVNGKAVYISNSLI